MNGIVQEPANGNHFDYTENTAAIYTSASGSIGHWTLQGGLRVEQTQTTGYSVTLNAKNRRSYLKLFPTLFLQYKINENNEFQLNYSYRTERPEFGLLNPARRYTSPYNYYTGNPTLQPAYVQNVEIGYTFEKRYNLTAYYTATYDIITNVNRQDNKTQIYYGTQANLGLGAMGGIRASAPLHLSAWWEANAVLDVFLQHEKSAYLGRDYNYYKLTYGANLNQSFTINKSAGLKAEVVGIFNGPNIQNVYQGRRNSEINVGLKANVLEVLVLFTWLLMIFLTLIITTSVSGTSSRTAAFFTITGRAILRSVLPTDLVATLPLNAHVAQRARMNVNVPNN